MTSHNEKIHVGVLFGGRSAEHEVSLQSAMNIVDAIDKERYDVTLIAVDKTGKWRLCDADRYLLNADDPKRIQLLPDLRQMAVVPGDTGRQVVPIDEGQSTAPLDVVFPVLHGPFGEDGSVQGLLKLADIPFVGADVLGSAIAMDKDVAKRLLHGAGIPTPRHRTVQHSQENALDLDAIVNDLGLPCFVKPANLGSSVGIGKVERIEDLAEAIATAFKFDRKVLIEEFIDGREIECAVLGNEDPETSVLGEIVPSHDFYSYEAKYLDENGAALVIPAPLPDSTARRIRDLAIQAFKTLECEGMARVDFFLSHAGDVYVNEINTIPGFTRISMYPKLWEASGVSYGDLVDRLIRLAIARHQRNQAHTSTDAGS